MTMTICSNSGTSGRGAAVALGVCEGTRVGMGAGLAVPGADGVSGGGGAVQDPNIRIKNRTKRTLVDVANKVLPPDVAGEIRNRLDMEAGRESCYNHTNPEAGMDVKIVKIEKPEAVN